MVESSEITINEKLKSFLEDLGKTYDEISEETGISRSVLFKITKPGATIKSDYIKIFKQIYGLDPGWLFGGDPENDTELEDEAQNEYLYEFPDHPQNILASEPLNALDAQSLRLFEKKVDELVNRIENGPYSGLTKIKLIDTLLRIVEHDLGKLRKPRDDNPDDIDSP